jgi:hypothetical protein
LVPVASSKVLEAIRRHLAVPDRMLNVLVPEVVLQSPRVVAVVGELEATGMAKHVWVDREWHLGGLADALDEAVEANRTVDSGDRSCAQTPRTVSGDCPWSESSGDHGKSRQSKRGA